MFSYTIDVIYPKVRLEITGILIELLIFTE